MHAKVELVAAPPTAVGCDVGNLFVGEPMQASLGVFRWTYHTHARVANGCALYCSHRALGLLPNAFQHPTFGAARRLGCVWWVGLGACTTYDNSKVECRPPNATANVVVYIVERLFTTF